jgi:hypothetical protein
MTTMTDDEHTAKLGELLQQLFGFVCESMTATKENMQRQSEWSARLQTYLEGCETSGS